MLKNNNRSGSNFQESLAKIITGVGFFATLVAFIAQLQQWLQNPQMIRAVSMASFILYLLGSLWLALKVEGISQRWRWTSLTALYVFSCLYFIWVGTWIRIAPQPVAIDTMDGISLWSTTHDDQGSSVTINPVPGQTTNAIEISYFIVEHGYVTVSREINPSILADTKAIRLWYTGSGASNTIELKFIYKPDSVGKSPVFGILWNHVTQKQDWTLIEAPYSSFVCWPATGCTEGEVLDLNKVWKVDIAISNKPPYDTAGNGIVSIDEILGIR